MTMIQLLATQVATAANLSWFNAAAISQNNSVVTIELDGTMELGHWRNNIAKRIYPNFYSDLQLSAADQFADALIFQGAKLYFNAKRFNEISELTDGKSYFFTFDYVKSRRFNSISCYCVTTTHSAAVFLRQVSLTERMMILS